MKVMRTILAACLLGGSAGIWAMEQKEEQKSQYDNSPRQQMTKIQKSKDGKDAKIFNRTEFHGFTAKELRDIELVQALEKYGLDFTDVKREQVPEGTDLGQVFMFDDKDLCKTIGMQKVVDKDQAVDSIAFGTKVIGYVFRGQDHIFYNSKVLASLLEDPLANGMNIALAGFLQEYSPALSYYYINTDSYNFSKTAAFVALLYKKMNPMIKVCMPEYSGKPSDPLRDSYNPEGETYKSRHKGDLPQMHLSLEKRILQNVPLTVTIEYDPLHPYKKNYGRDALHLALHRGFKPEVEIFNLFKSAQGQSSQDYAHYIEQTIEKDFQHFAIRHEGIHSKIVGLTFTEITWEVEWIQAIYTKLYNVYDALSLHRNTRHIAVDTWFLDNKYCLPLKLRENHGRDQQGSFSKRIKKVIASDTFSMKSYRANIQKEMSFKKFAPDNIFQKTSHQQEAEYSQEEDCSKVQNVVKKLIFSIHEVQSIRKIIDDYIIKILKEKVGDGYTVSHITIQEPDWLPYWLKEISVKISDIRKAAGKKQGEKFPIILEELGSEYTAGTLRHLKDGFSVVHKHNSFETTFEKKEGVSPISAIFTPDLFTTTFQTIDNGLDTRLIIEEKNI